MPRKLGFIAATAVTLAVGIAPAASQAALRTASVTPTAQVAPTYRTTSVTAGATGQGPATQSECDAWADYVNEFQAASDASAARGDKEGARFYADLAWDYEDNAQNRGCFIVP